MITQRLHEDDLVGHALQQNDWKVIKLPAIAEETHYHTIHTLYVEKTSSRGTIENGFVYVPAQAEWIPDYLHELSAFPKGKYDDQVDSTSQAFDWAKQGMGRLRS